MQACIIPEDGRNVSALVDSLLGTVGEKVEATRGLKVAVIENTGAVGAYVHPGGAYGSLVGARLGDDSTDPHVAAQAGLLCDQIAQHVVAMDPDAMEALLNQPYVLDSSTTVGKKVESTACDLGIQIELTSFVRWER